MMSAAVNPMNGANSTMPGDYESWPAPAARNAFGGSPPPPSSMIPPMRTPFPQISSAPPTAGLPTRTPFPRLPPAGATTGLPMRRSPIGRRRRSRRHRRRPLTPEIVIERRPHGRSSWGRHRVITIPLDHRPTLGLRGPPTRVIEIKRVRCHRRRRSPSICYEYDYDDPSPPSQPPITVANPIAISPAQPLMTVAQPLMTVPMNNTAAASSAFLSNLTPEMINNLPRQTVHLQPVHLPGSQADENAGLHTVIFPAEIINPLDGTLSIIQDNSGANNGGPTTIQPISTASVQPQLINMPTTVGIPVAPGRPPVSPAMATDPLMQRFTQLFQRLSIPQTQPISSASIPPVIRPALSNMSQFSPRNTTMINRPTISSSNTANLGGYPPANIRPTNPLTIGSYRPASVTPTIPANINTYRPTNIAPSGPVSNMSYRPSSFTPSALANNATYRPTNIIPSNSSDIGPYQPANITPYANIAYPSNNNRPLQPSFSSGPTPYTSAPSIASSSSFTPFPRLSSFPSGYGNNSMNPSSSSLSVAPTSNQSINSVPKSILRNTSSNGLPNTTYTRLNSPNVMSSNDTIRKTTRFV